MSYRAGLKGAIHRTHFDWRAYTPGGLHAETVEYKQGDTTLAGFLACDDSIKGPLPVC
jgi:hypothetical protein